MPGKLPNKRVIMHVDMDAFYASVEQLDHPEYRGRPVIVGSDPKGGHGRGVVSAASYEARAFGVHSAMPISRAYKACPHGVFVRGRMGRYQEISEQIMQFFLEITPCVEPISLDEAFLDVSGSERLHGSAESIGRKLKADIRSQIGLTASVGIGPNKLIAKIASDLKKPDGFVFVPHGEEALFLKDLPVGRIWGVGKVTRDRLAAMGVQTAGDLAALPEKLIIQTFGKHGACLCQYARGIDYSPVISEREAKSVSNETTFERDVTDLELIRKTLLWLSSKVASRLRKHGIMGRTITLKVRWDDFTTMIRHETCAAPTDLEEDIFAGIWQLWERFDFAQRPIRLLGVGVTQLCDAENVQVDLFGEVNKRKTVAETLDRLKQKFGDKVIKRGA